MVGIVGVPVQGGSAHMLKEIMNGTTIDIPAPTPPNGKKVVDPVLNLCHNGNHGTLTNPLNYGPNLLRSYSPSSPDSRSRPQDNKDDTGLTPSHPLLVPQPPLGVANPLGGIFMP